MNRILRTGIEEISNKMGESDGKTLFDAVGSLNTNLDKPLNELIEDESQEILDTVIEVGRFKSPIKILTGSINASKGKSISGTGKGLLQVYKLTNYGSLTINIDGVSASAFNPSDNGGWMQLEFAKSYSVSLDDGSAAYLAMFY